MKAFFEPLLFVSEFKNRALHLQITLNSSFNPIYNLINVPSQAAALCNISTWAIIYENCHDNISTNLYQKYIN